MKNKNYIARELQFLTNKVKKQESVPESRYCSFFEVLLLIYLFIYYYRITSLIIDPTCTSVQSLALFQLALTCGYKTVKVS